MGDLKKRPYIAEHLKQKVEEAKKSGSKKIIKLGQDPLW